LHTSPGVSWNGAQPYSPARNSAKKTRDSARMTASLAHGDGNDFDRSSNSPTRSFRPAIAIAILRHLKSDPVGLLGQSGVFLLKDAAGVAGGGSELPDMACQCESSAGIWLSALGTSAPE
jgi:hypothetical protein